MLRKLWLQKRKRTEKMEKNENGYPIMREGCYESEEATLHDKPLGYAYVPVQRWRMMYSPEEGLSRGTMFEELYKPLEVYGNE
jgi:hypothetical protein